MDNTICRLKLFEIFLNSIKEKMKDSEKFWVNLTTGVGQVHFKKLEGLTDSDKEKTIGDFIVLNGNLQNFILNGILIKKQGTTSYIPIDVPLLFKSDEEKEGYMKLRNSLVFS